MMPEFCRVAATPPVTCSAISVPDISIDAAAPTLMVDDDPENRMLPLSQTDVPRRVRVPSVSVFRSALVNVADP